MSIFEGAGVALVTPFHEDGSVNYEKLEQIVEEQIAGGTDCIIACGTTGEAATLSHEEHIEVIRFVCQVVNKRIPVVAGTGSNCTETAVYLSTEAKKAGADGLAAINTIKSIMNVDLNGFSTSPNVIGKSSANVPTTFSEMNQMYSACLLMPTMMTAWQKYAHEFMFRTKEQRI